MNAQKFVHAARPPTKRKNSGKNVEKAARVKAARARGAAAAAAADPVLESNDEVQDMQLDNPTDDPVGRRIDDVLTTAQTFDVAGFGEVPTRPLCPRLCHWGGGCAPPRPPPYHGSRAQWIGLCSACFRLCRYIHITHSVAIGWYW